MPRVPALQIGGSRAPTPVGDLGFVEMTQALQLADVQWQQVGTDLLLTGYLPQSGGLRALAAAAAAADVPDAGPAAQGLVLGSSSSGSSGSSSGSSSSRSAAGVSGVHGEGAAGGTARHPGSRLEPAGVAEFYKAWDRYGCLSNFSPHPIRMPEGPMTAQRAQQLHEAAQQRQRQRQQSDNGAGSSSSSSSGSVCDSGSGEGWRQWPSVEHYYQAQKFAGSADPEAAELVQSIAAAASPEEAARLGRRAQRHRAGLLRPDWEDAKVSVMLAALRAKCATHTGPRSMLLATSGSTSSSGRGGDASPSGLELVESSPHDFFWGRGYDGSGANMLGKLLMQVRAELLQQQPPLAVAAAAAEAAAAGGTGRAQQQPAGV